MPNYIYRAVDSGGKRVRGQLEASSETEVIVQLAKLGYLPLEILSKETRAFVLPSFLGQLRIRRISLRSLTVFTRQFATIVKAAVPIVEGLKALSEMTESPLLRRTLKKVTEDVEGGLSLSSALAKHPYVFSELYVNTIIAGESAGALDKVLLRLAQMLEDDLATRTTTMSALRYPIIVIIALFLALSVLSFMVIPQFAKIYLELNVSLPLPTRIMIFVSTILRRYWYISLIFLIGLFLGFRFYINTHNGRLRWDRLKFRLPLLGKIYTKIIMLRFATIFGILYQAGLPILQNLDITARAIGNLLLMSELGKVKRDVADGKGVSGAILSSRYFPPMVGYLLSVGEKSGEMSAVLESIISYYYLEIQTSIKNLTTMIEPVLTVILGIFVLVMALAIFLPLWGMIAALKGG